MKKAAGYFGFVAAIVLMAIAASAFIAPRFGWRADVVLTGSMEPALKVGSVVITRPLNSRSVNAGDVITFRSPLNGRLTTHRVISVESKPSFILRTKGDANEDPDPFVLGSRSVVGRVCFNVPHIGYAITFMKTRLGLLLTLFLPALIIVVFETRNIWRALSAEPARKQTLR